MVFTLYTCSYDQLERWCHEAGVNVAMEFTSKSPPVKPTHLNETNVFWVEFEKVINELWVLIYSWILYGLYLTYFYRELNTKLRVFESATDSRFLREVRKYIFLFMIRKRVKFKCACRLEFQSLDLHRSTRRQRCCTRMTSTWPHPPIWEALRFTLNCWPGFQMPRLYINQWFVKLNWYYITFKEIGLCG